MNGLGEVRIRPATRNGKPPPDTRIPGSYLIIIETGELIDAAGRAPSADTGGRDNGKRNRPILQLIFKQEIFVKRAQTAPHDCNPMHLAKVTHS